MLLAASFNSTALFRSPLDLLLFREFSTANFGQAFTRGAFWFFFQNSVIILVGGGGHHPRRLRAPMAYGLSKISGRARSAVSFGVLAMRFIPYVVLALPLFLLYVNLGPRGIAGRVCCSRTSRSTFRSPPGC